MDAHIVLGIGSERRGDSDEVHARRRGEAVAHGHSAWIVGGKVETAVDRVNVGRRQRIVVGTVIANVRTVEHVAILRLHQMRARGTISDGRVKDRPRATLGARDGRGAARLRACAPRWEQVR